MAGMVIIGCGQAGGQAAASLRQEKYEGPITMIGQEPYIPYHQLMKFLIFLKQLLCLSLNLLFLHLKHLN